MHDADIQFSVVEFRMRSYFHSAAKCRSIGNRGQQGWLGVGRRVIGIAIGIVFAVAIQRNLHRKWREAEKLTRRTKRVPAMGANPAGKAVGAAGDGRVNSNSGDAAEIRGVGRHVWRGRPARGL